jgi:hypothetical protein
MACAWRHVLVMNWLQAGWQKYYSHTHRRDTGGVCAKVLSTEGPFISTVQLFRCRRSHRGSQEWLLYTVVCATRISRKIQKTVSQLLPEALRMKHSWFTTVPYLLVFCSVLFYEHTEDTNKGVIRNAAYQASCKYG